MHLKQTKMLPCYEGFLTCIEYNKLIQDVFSKWWNQGKDLNKQKRFKLKSEWSLMRKTWPEKKIYIYLGRQQ